MTETRAGYHHGDLREALILAALEMLEAGEAFSLLSVARRAGVSTAAPYRHFADREALESALAVHGLRELMREISGVPDPAPAAEPVTAAPSAVEPAPVADPLPAADPAPVAGPAPAADPAPVNDLGEIAVAYVRFAQRRPELFRLMFGRPCDDRDDERVRAAGALHDFIETLVRDAFPQADPSALATAGWSIAHGLAVLHLDGKLDNSDPVAIDARVRSAVAAVFPGGARAEGASA